MYISDEMIYMGLRKNEKFKSDTHRIVAQNIGLCNPMVRDLDTLTAVVTSINAIPKERIKKITLEELEHEFNCPVVW